MKKYSQAKACRGILNTKYWWVFIILLLIILGVASIFVNRANSKAQVTIDNKTFQVELARTGAEREKGLMNRESLDANSGMLFIFPTSGIQSFWMKNTLIPLDIIWLAPSMVEGMYNIVEMTTLNPETGDITPEYTPKNKANYVLELNAGQITANNFKVGDIVKIKY